MVVIHRRSNHGRIYHCKKIIFLVEKQKRKGNLYSCYIVQPFSSILNGRMGSGVGTIQLMKMVAGVINPGRPVANLYVSSRALFCIISWRLSLFSRKKVFHVEPRRYIHFFDPCGRSQDWSIP